MSLNDSKASRRTFSSFALNYFGVTKLILVLSSTTTFAWIHSTPSIHNAAMIRGGEIFRDGERPNAYGRSQRSGSATTTPNRPPSSGLLLSPLKQATPASSNDNGLEKSRTILDATLVGDYLVQMSSTGESFAWQLYSIRDVVQASLTGSGSYDDGIIWTDGTRAAEALSYGLSSAAAEALSGLTPRAELLCFPSTDGDAFDSKALWVDEGNPGGDKILLLLLQILQAQWVAGIQGTQRQHEPTTTSESSGNTDDEWRISRDSLLSQEGISGLFGEAGLLDGDARDMEWVEMMTGSSRIVGRLPRSFVHKFNVLHRGIGAFITRDRPIDVSSLQSSSSPTTPVPDLYVHRRSADKRIFPSLYDMFVGGVSLAGEDSELSAQREIAEELGLSRALSTSLVAKSGGGPLLTCLVCTAYNRCLVDLFQYTMDTSIETVKWQEEEVAWGDFVDYQVISASADLSMQRAAVDRTWPGSYPPIQSKLRGVLPEEESSKVANYDGNWKEWNYVPDGLLVWKAWLEMIETNKDDQQQRQIGQPVLSFEVEFSLGDGNTEVVTVELESMKDIVPQSQQLSARFNTDINDMQSMLKQMWADATVVPVYDGPSLAIESIDDHAECTIELPSGLVLELRPSTIGEDAGLGLFVRKASPRVDDVLQTQGSAFCGYGRCDQITDSLEGVTQYQRQRSFEFRLSDGLESYVWYKGNLLTVGDVIKSTGATAVKSHVLKEMPGEDQDGDVPSSSQLALIHDPAGKPCYLIPPAERPDPKSLTIQTIGHMCNDLAGGERGQTEGGYDAASERNNLLVLVPRVTVNDDGVLEPTGMPILTLAQSVYVGNVGESMEVGLRYGDSYWSRESS